MKMKKIMLITCLLLAILTIGAVSASEDIASDDNLTASDTVSVVADDDIGDETPDEGDGDEDENYEEYQVEIMDEFDVNDEDATVVSVYCPEDIEGEFTVEVYDEDDEDQISEYPYEIDESDYDTTIEFTVGDLEITTPGFYTVYVFYDGEELDRRVVEAVDYTQFRVADWYEGPSLYFIDPILTVYCPEGSAGNITVNVRKDGEDEIFFTSQKDIEYADDEGMLYWTLYELNMNSVEKFKVEVLHDGEYMDDADIDVELPFFINHISYINATDNIGNMFTLFVPNDINGTVTLKIGEVEIISIALAEFTDVENDDKPFWAHPYFGPGAPDYNQKAYVIQNKHVNYEFEEADYNLTAIVVLEDDDPLVNTEEIRFFKRCVAGNENITIEIFKGDYELSNEFDETVIAVSAEEDCEGYIVITVADTEFEWSDSVEELMEEYEGIIGADFFDELEAGEYEITVAYYNDDDELILNTTGTVNFYEEEEEYDDEYSVNIWVDEDDNGFDLNDEDDLESIFAAVSVEDGLEGFIIIRAIGADEEGADLFDKELSEIEYHEFDLGREGFTCYNIVFNDLDNLDALKEQEILLVAFFTDHEVAVSEYYIDFEDGIVRFTEVDYNGEEIDVEFADANVITDDPVIIISKDDLPEDVDDDFDVTLIDGEEEFETELSLIELEEDDDENYIIRVSDLNVPEIGESRHFEIVVQFYVDGEGTYYAETGDEDEDLVNIYTNPYIAEEANILNNDGVISFRPFYDQDDEFNVTIKREGFDDVVKTFKLSEILEDYDEDDDRPLCEITVKDLNITEEGEYQISILFTMDGEELADNEGNVTVGLFDIIAIEPDEEYSEFSKVTDTVFIIKVDEDIAGFVRLYIDEDQIGDDIDLSDLHYTDMPPIDGRHVLLNDFGINETGSYNVKVEVYDEEGNFLKGCENEIPVEVSANSVEFFSNGFGCEDIEVIHFNIGSPLSDDEYFNIYFNGELAGTFTMTNGLEIDDEYTVEFDDTRFMKTGTYQVNVTFICDETETDFETGEFSVVSLNVTTDDEVYFEDDDVIISFNITDPSTVYGELRLYYLYGAGPMGLDEDLIFNTLSGDEILEVWQDGTVTMNIETLEAGTNYIHVTYDYAANKEDYENGIDVTRLGDIIAIDVLGYIEYDFSIEPIDDVEQGTDVVIIITSNKTFSGNVTVKVGKIVKNATLINGVGNITISTAELDAGEATVIVSGDKQGAFSEESMNITFNVTGKSAQGGNGTPTGNTTTNETGNNTSGNTTTNETGNNTSGNTTTNETGSTTPVTQDATPTTTTETTTATETIKLTLKTVKIKKSAKKLVLQATLKINGKAKKGKILKFKFKGKTYKAKTNKKGVAKVTIKKSVLKKLKVGKKVKYQVSYGKKTVKKTAKVKK